MKALESFLKDVMEGVRILCGVFPMQALQVSWPQLKLPFQRAKCSSHFAAILIAAKWAANSHCFFQLNHQEEFHELVLIWGLLLISSLPQRLALQRHKAKLRHVLQQTASKP